MNDDQEDAEPGTTKTYTIRLMISNSYYEGDATTATYDEAYAAVLDKAPNIIQPDWDEWYDHEGRYDELMGEKVALVKERDALLVERDALKKALAGHPRHIHSGNACLSGRDAAMCGEVSDPQGAVLLFETPEAPAMCLGCLEKTRS